MFDDKTKAPKTSRWKPGGKRYGKDDSAVLKKVRPVDGWKNGARVTRRPGK